MVFETGTAAQGRSAEFFSLIVMVDVVGILPQTTVTWFRVLEPEMEPPPDMDQE